MGKIVRGAKLVGEAYVVAVPELARESDRRSGAGRANGVADPRDGLSFDDADQFLTEDAIEAEVLEPSVDIEQVRADARALVDAASEDAEKLLREAAQRAREMLGKATAGVNEIETQARAKGEKEGEAAGRSAAAAELADSIATIHQLIESVRAERSAVIEAAEPELVRLAMAVAERIVYDHVAIDPQVVIENVRHALTRLVGREVVTLRVNPADLEILRQYRDGIAASNDVEHLRIVEDQRVDRGGVVIETDAGTIDAKIATQVREARHALQSGDTIAVSQAS